MSNLDQNTEPMDSDPIAVFNVTDSSPEPKEISTSDAARLLRAARRPREQRGPATTGYGGIASPARNQPRKRKIASPRGPTLKRRKVSPNRSFRPSSHPRHGRLSIRIVSAPSLVRRKNTLRSARWNASGC